MDAIALTAFTLGLGFHVYLICVAWRGIKGLCHDAD